MNEANTNNADEPISALNSKIELNKTAAQTADYEKSFPRMEEFVSSPLRNRMELQLNKPASEVYALVGDPAQMPVYSSGLERVITVMIDGKCKRYTCFFKPVEGSEKGYVHIEDMVWQAQNRGWASRAVEPNEMGFTEYGSLITLTETNDDNTLLTWSMYYNHENIEMIEMNKQGLLEVFNDMAQHLIARFGGILLSNGFV